MNTEDRNPELKNIGMTLKLNKKHVFWGRGHFMQTVHVGFSLIRLLQSDGGICTKILWSLIGPHSFLRPQQKIWKELSPFSLSVLTKCFLKCWKACLICCPKCMIIQLVAFYYLHLTLFFFCVVALLWIYGPFLGHDPPAGNHCFKY